MSKRFAVVPTLLSVLVAMVAAPAPAAAASGAATSTVQVQQARVFAVRGFGRRSPSVGSRYRYGSRTPLRRSYRRPGLFHGVFGGILKALGIAYLFHLFFGI